MRKLHCIINGNIYSGKRVEEAFEIVTAMVNNRFQDVDVEKMSVAEIARLNAFGLAASEFKRRHGGTDNDAKRAIEYLVGKEDEEIAQPAAIA